MATNIPAAVRNLISEYRRFLRTSYRFLDQKLREQFEQHLAAADVVVRGPYVTLTRDFATGRTLAELVRDGLAHADLPKARWAFGARALFRHQERAFEIGRQRRPFVVTTGTGSGKTEAFLLPVIDDILRQKARNQRGVQAILLYPMNALANDQLERLRRLIRGTGLDVSYALYTGDSDATVKRLREEPAETERKDRSAIRSHPPDILLTNYKQLEFLLVRRDDRSLFSPALRWLVLDEVHSYRGALATEIACLIRRLKAHAKVPEDGLVGIGTSATVAAREGGMEDLARFATVLLGENVRVEDIVQEDLAVRRVPTLSYVPPVPALQEADLTATDTEDADSVIALVRRLTGRACAGEGHVSERVAAALEGNRIVDVLEESLTSPSTVAKAVQGIRTTIPERADTTEDAIRREVEAYLLVGSVGDDEHPPRLRPKLHVFFHGVYDVALCLDPACRTLVPQGGSECSRCGAAARPAALCRTCGQDFVKVRFEKPGDDRPVGTADFYSDQQTAFLTHRIHDLWEAPGLEDEEVEEAPPKPVKKRARSDGGGPARLEPTRVCMSCGRLAPEAEACPQCARPTVAMLIWKGGLNTCPACGDIYTRGDIVTPLRTGTASTVSVLATHHLDRFEGQDRKLLVFADNRQDVAHQSGYMADKHRAFALRHFMVKEVADSGAGGVSLDRLPERLFDRYQELRIIRRRPTASDREMWLESLRYEAASELTRYSRQRASLENLGLIAIEYEFLDDLRKLAAFQVAAAETGLETGIALNLVRAVLDVMRKNRAVAFTFFQEYLDSTKRKYREMEAEPYSVRFPDRDRAPKAFALDRPDHIRKSGRLLGFFQENAHAGALAAPQKVVARLVGDRQRAESFLRAIVPLISTEELPLLVHAAGFPIPAKERVTGLRPLQIDPRVIRLRALPEGFRCNACQTWRAYEIPTCPTPRCTRGHLQKSVPPEDNYYVRLYRDRPPRRLAVQEHSAQVGAEDRAQRETDFKEGRLDVLVCTPTLELGVDIGPLLSVVLRNAPPTPANYAQRIGRAGRRLRIGFGSTFCAGGSHDRHAFEHPEWLVAGRFDPPRLRLDNAKVVVRHLRSHVLELLDAQLPMRMGQLLDDLRTPTRWLVESLAPLFAEIQERRGDLIEGLDRILAEDRVSGRIKGDDVPASDRVLDSFKEGLNRILERWWQRVSQLDREFREFSTIGSPRHDERKASARKRAYYEITQDPESAYVLNYLATQGFLPAYQFPLDTFSLDPGVEDTPTIYRASSVAIEEFAPGNFVYANGHKLKSIRVLYPGGPGAELGHPGRTDAETSGRLQSFHFCERCGEVVEAPRNACPRCAAGLPPAVATVFVEAFEAEQNLKIGSDEESRQRQAFDRREGLILPQTAHGRLFPYDLSPVEHVHLAEILITNWGRRSGKSTDGQKFRLCPDCGRHLSHDPEDLKQVDEIRKWRDNHARFCSGEPAPLVLAYRFQTDCMILTVPPMDVADDANPRMVSPSLATLAEALLAGARTVLEVEPQELGSFVRRSPPGAPGGQIVFYETVPGGAGYTERMAERLADVARAAAEVLYGHDCRRACYLCLKHYGNQRWHSILDKECVRDVLFVLQRQPRMQPVEQPVNSGLETLDRMLSERAAEAQATAVPGPRPGQYRHGIIEEPLAAALATIPDLPEPLRDHEICEGDRLVTVPDFCWLDVKLAVYCDGYAVHGNVDTLSLDARKRNWLQLQGWAVLTYWGRMLLRDAAACAIQIADVYRRRRQPGSR